MPQTTKVSTKDFWIRIVTTFLFLFLNCSLSLKKNANVKKNSYKKNSFGTTLLAIWLFSQY